MSTPVILIVEDDAPIRRGVADALRFGGYAVRECADGDSGLTEALGGDVDLVLLDVLLPGRDGFSVLRELRQGRPRLPVIMLTAKGSEDSRVRGLRDGADDYVVKPFSARELLARVEAVLRRSAERPLDVERLRLPEGEVDFERREHVAGDGTVRALSEREVEILRYLAAHPGRAVDRRELLRHVWGYREGVETRTVDMAMARLREKIEPDPRQPRIVLTVRSLGYMLAREAAS